MAQIKHLQSFSKRKKSSLNTTLGPRAIKCSIFLEGAKEMTLHLLEWIFFSSPRFCTDLILLIWDLSHL